MNKDFLGEMEAWVKKREKGPRDAKLVAFLAVRPDIEKALEAGYTAKTVWAYMQESGRIAFSYVTFLSYLKRYGLAPSQQRQPPQQTNALRQRLVAAGKLPESAAPSTAAKPKPKATGFTYNPSPNPADLL